MPDEQTETDGAGATEAIEGEGSPSTDGPTGRDRLEAAIEENPEAVAAFVERLDAVNELLDVMALGQDALTDEMVTEMAGTGSTLAESADGLATEETARLAESVGEHGDDLADALDTLVDLQRRGTLAELADLANAASLANDALTDEMVVSLARTGSSLGELADTAAEPDTRDGLARLLSAVGDAEAADPGSTGTLDLLRSFRDDDVRQGLAYVLALARAIGADTEDGTTGT